MLEDAFKMMGEEKDGVIRVHKEAERKLKVMQQEYEVFILKICNKNMRLHFQIPRENPLTLLNLSCPLGNAQVLRQEKEKLVRRDKGLAVKFKQFQEEMAMLQVIGGEALFAKNGGGLVLLTLNRTQVRS